MKIQLKSIIYFLFLVPVLGISQSENPLRNGIGVHLAYDAEGGLVTSLRYSRQIANRGIMKLEFKTNASGNYVGRIGYEFLRLGIDRFELGLGLDLRYRIDSNKKYGLSSNYKELAIELPIELRYHLTPNYFISTGISFSERLSRNNEIYRDNSASPEIRFGLGYKF